MEGFSNREGPQTITQETQALILALLHAEDHFKLCRPQFPQMGWAGGQSGGQSMVSALRVSLSPLSSCFQRPFSHQAELGPGGRWLNRHPTAKKPKLINPSPADSKEARLASALLAGGINTYGFILIAVLSQDLPVSQKTFNQAKSFHREPLNPVPWGRSQEAESHPTRS